MEAFEVEQVAVVQPTRLEWIRNRIRHMGQAERNYFFASSALSVILVALVIATVLLSTSGGDPYCMSKECIDTASLFIGGMNTSVDPCTDFYKFACGNWKHVELDEEDNWVLRRLKDTTSQAAELLARKNSETDHEAVKKARSLFRSCMDTDALDDLGLEPLFDLLESAGLPRGIPHYKTVADFDLSRGLARVHRTIGKAVFLDVIRENNETFIVSVPQINVAEPPNPVVLTMIQDYLDNNKNHSQQILHTPFNSEWMGFIKNVTNFGLELEVLRSRRYSTIHENPDFLPPNMILKPHRASAITNLLYKGEVPQDKSRTVNYEVYMETLLEGIPDVNWSSSNGTLRLIDPEFQSSILTYLQHMDPVLIQMIVWMEVIKHFELYTTTEFRLRMKSRELAKRSQAPRSASCADLVINLMPVAIDHLIAQVDPLTEVTEQIKAMAKEIQSTQRKIVEGATWLDQSRLENILHHLDDVEVVRVGYIDWVKEGRGLDDFFKDVHIHEGKLLKTIADIQVWQAETNLFVSPKIGRLRTDDIKSGVYYHRSLHTISIRPTTMRHPFYSLGLDALNYGAMGVLIGHELAHSLDTLGFDENDYFLLRKPELAKLVTFVKCTKSSLMDILMEQHEAYPDLTINEDISDITGLKTAFHSFRKIRKGPEPHLPGLEKFSHDQLFFLAFANILCTNGRFSRTYKTDMRHTDYRLRVLNALSNSPEFSATWNCSTDAFSRMNNTEKCVLW